jgi:hypothetical protein
VAELSLRAYAKHRQISLRAVQKAIASGRISTTAAGKIQSDIADVQWGRNTAPRPATRPAPARVAKSQPTHQIAEPLLRAESPGHTGIDYSKARAIRESYLAKLAKMEFEERSGNLISRHEVEVAAFNRFRTFRDNMLNIADRLSAVLAAENDAASVHQILSTDIRKALEDSTDATNRS